MPEPKDYAKRLARGSSIIFAGLAIAGVMGILLRMFLTRTLSEYDYGLFYAVFVAVSFFGLFRDLGLYTALEKFTPEFMLKKKYGEVKSSMIITMLVQMLLTLPLTIFLLLFSDQIAVAVIGTVAASLMIKVFAVWLFLTIFFNVFRFTYQGFQDPVPYTGMEVFYPVLTLGLAFLFVSVFNFGVAGVALAYLVGVPILVAAWVGLVWKRRPQVITGKTNVGKPLAKKLLKFGLPVFLAGMAATVLGYTDTIMLSIIHGPTAVGLYQAAQPLTTMISYFTAALGMVLLPMVSEIWARGERAVLSKAMHSILKFSTIIITLPVFILAAFPDTILRTMFGAQYVLAAATLQVLTFVLILSSLFLILQCVSAGVGKPMIATKAVAVMALLNVILNAMLIPGYSTVGAAVATFIAQFVGLVIMLYLMGKFIRFVVPVSSILKTIVAGGISLFFIIGLKTLIVLDPWWVRAIIIAVPSVLLYAGLILVMRAVNRDDLDLVGGTMPFPKRLVELAKKLTK